MFGMNNVDSSWNGPTEAYEIDCSELEDDYLANDEMKTCDMYVSLPGTSGHKNGGRVKQLGAAGINMRPPLTASIGLQDPPECLNPYLNQSDGSHVLGFDDYYSSPYDSRLPRTSVDRSQMECEAATGSIPQLSFDPEMCTPQPKWGLSERDLESLFIDSYSDEIYMSNVKNMNDMSQYCAMTDRDGYKGILNPLPSYDCPKQVKEDSAYAFSSLFSQTQESEVWTAAEIQATDYVYQFFPKHKKEIEVIKPSPKPEITMVADGKGNTAPMSCGVMVAKAIAGRSSSRLLRVLFDSGGGKSLIHRRAIPRGAKLTPPNDKTALNTIAGIYHPLGKVNVNDMRLPAFDKNRIIDEHEFQVFDQDCRYDMIIGADLLRKIGMNLMFDTLEIEWCGNVIPMQTLDRSDLVAAHIDIYLSHIEQEELGFDIDSYVAEPILDAKYESWDADQIVNELCGHLEPAQKDDLKKLLIKHHKLFDGKLGLYTGDKMHIELEPGAQAVYRRPYPIPRVHLEAFKKELDHLVSLGVLSPVRDTAWGLPTFITPKKDGRIRWVSDMRALNKVIKRTQYTLPIITDVLRRRKGYEFLTKLDISMQYYTFELTDESKKLCTIVTPFGPFCYNRVPMGLSTSPGFAQARMEEVLRNIDELEVYIDDIGIFTETWERHIHVLSETLTRLEEAGFTINPLKCEWGVKETDWLGYWLTPTGLKPWAKKVDTIMKLQPPRTATELRTFLGMVTYYRDMWPRRSHVLEPFTKLSGMPGKKTKVKWTAELDAAFKQMKAVLAEDCLMAYPNHNKPFEIYTDASDYQLGGCIMQEGRPVAYYSRKLTPAQKNYTTMEKELLAIVMILKEFRTMLLGARLRIYTDHRNLTFANFNTQRVLRWRTYVEEYSPELFYIAGKNNVLADAFSRLPSFEDPSSVVGRDDKDMSPIQLDAYHLDSSGHDIYDCLKYLPDADAYFSYLNLPITEKNPLSLRWLAEMQSAEAKLLQLAKTTDTGYHVKEFEDDIKLVCYTKPGNDEDTDWKIVLTDEALQPSLQWFHLYLSHPGRERLLQGMRRYYHPDLRKAIVNFTCDACQRHKVDTRGYGQLPARDVRAAPWEQVDIDLIGPWQVKTKNASYEFLALTSIDRVTGLPELIRVDNKTSAHISDKFEESWLSRYPRPLACCHDNGGEFTGWEFQELLQAYSIKDVPTTSRNPAANGICERMHKTVGNILRTLIHEHGEIRTKAEAQRLVDSALARASHGIKTNIHTATGYTPGDLAFHRDMLLNIPLMIDFVAVRDRRRVTVNENLRRSNAKRSSYDYQPQQQVLKKRHEFGKLGDRWDGPFSIKRVHTNGNITIQLRPGVTERLNIRRVKPYHAPTLSAVTSNATQAVASPIDTTEDRRPTRARFSGTYSAFNDYWF